MVVEDPGTPGDAIVDRCARVAPPGTRVTLMGIQNIKGTGLDFVYRFVGLDAVAALLDRASSGSPREQAEALRALAERDDMSLLDAGLAAHRLEELSETIAPALRADAARAERKAAALHGEALARLGRADGVPLGRRLLSAIERLLDPLDSLRRRRRAQRVMRDLALGRVSHERAAAEMRALTERGKGGWLG